MKILIYGNSNLEYLEDLIINGLIELGHEVTIVHRKEFLLKENEQTFDIKTLYGYGFSTTFTITKNLIFDTDENSYIQKINDKYFDLIIFNVTGTIFNEVDFYKYNYLLNLAHKQYNYDQIFILDGNDDVSISYLFYMNIGKCLYFKRDFLDGEGLHSNTFVFPISYSIPKSKFGPKTLENKTNFVIDNNYTYEGMCYNRTKILPYVYENENEYYEYLRSAWFCLTGKKGGYCRMTHYESIANYTLPVFIDYQYIPRGAMTNWPSFLQYHANGLYHDYYFGYHPLDINKYKSLVDQFYDYAYEYLTTEAVAKYILSFM